MKAIHFNMLFNISAPGSASNSSRIQMEKFSEANFNFLITKLEALSSRKIELLKVVLFYKFKSLESLFNLYLNRPGIIILHS